MKEYKYNQFYYTWAPKEMSRGSLADGLCVVSSSSEDVNLQEKSTAIAKQRKYELDGQGIITEYFQYMASLDTYAFAGIHGIEPPSKKVVNRDTQLTHILVPAEPIDEENPSSYIPNCKIEYNRMKSLDGELGSLVPMVMPFKPFDYQALLKKYNLTDVSRLAVLLSMEFQGFFSARKRQIAFPLNEELTPDEYLQTAKEITWLLHCWVPEGLKKSAKELRQMMGYVVAKTTKGKDPKLIGQCFVPKNGEISIPQFDLWAVYDAQKKIDKGAEFFFVMAKKAQESADALQKFIQEIIAYSPGKIDRMDDILEAYECCKIEDMDAADLPSWTQAGMEKKLLETRQGNPLSKRYCLTYLKCGMEGDNTLQLTATQVKDCWDTFTNKNQKLSEGFFPLLPSFLDLSFEFWQNPDPKLYKDRDKNQELYAERLSILEDEDDRLWKSVYQRNQGCIQKHLAMIQETRQRGSGIDALEQCLQYYGAALGSDENFRREIWKYTEQLYGQSSEAIREKIESHIKENSNVFSLDNFNQLKLELLPVDCLAFCKMYADIQDAELRQHWYQRINIHYGKEHVDIKPTLEQYQVLVSLQIVQEDMQTVQCQEFHMFLKNLAMQGKTELEFCEAAKKSSQEYSDRGYVFFWLLYEKEQSGSWNELTSVWDVIEEKGSKALKYLNNFKKFSGSYGEILKNLLESEDLRAVYYRIQSAFEENQKFQNSEEDIQKLQTAQQEKLAKEMLYFLISQIKSSSTSLGITIRNLDNRSQFFLQFFSNYGHVSERFATCWEWVYQQLQQVYQRQNLYEIFIERWRRYGEPYAKEAVKYLENYKTAYEYLESVQRVKGVDSLRRIKLCYASCEFVDSAKKEEFRDKLIEDALKLYGNKKDRKAERQEIQKLMQDVQGWKEASTDVYKDYSVTEFVQITLEDAEQYPACAYQKTLKKFLQQDVPVKFSELKNIIEIVESGFLSEEEDAVQQEQMPIATGTQLNGRTSSGLSLQSVSIQSEKTDMNKENALNTPDSYQKPTNNSKKWLKDVRNISSVGEEEKKNAKLIERKRLLGKL